MFPAESTNGTVNGTAVGESLRQHTDGGILNYISYMSHTLFPSYFPPPPLPCLALSSTVHCVIPPAVPLQPPLPGEFSLLSDWAAGGHLSTARNTSQEVSSTFTEHTLPICYSIQPSHMYRVAYAHSTAVIIDLES